MEVITKFQKNMLECSLLAKGKVKPFRPGDKREILPEWDRDRCIRCGLCYIFCPDGAIYRTEDGFFEISEEKCKGCGICHRECWFGAINMVKEASNG